MQGAGVFRLLLFWPAGWMNGVCCGKMDSGGVAVNGVLRMFLLSGDECILWLYYGD